MRWQSFNLQTTLGSIVQLRKTVQFCHTYRELWILWILVRINWVDWKNSLQRRWICKPLDRKHEEKTIAQSLLCIRRYELCSSSSLVFELCLKCQCCLPINYLPNWSQQSLLLYLPKLAEWLRSETACLTSLCHILIPVAETEFTYNMIAITA